MKHLRTGGSSGDDLASDSRPLLHEGVAFEEDAVQGQWIVLREGVPVSRASTVTVRLLEALDGRTPLSSLHERFDPAADEEAFVHLVSRFRGAGLLAGGRSPVAGRVTYRPPLTLQVATLRAPAFFARLDALLRPVSPGWLLLPLAAVLLAGAVAIVVQLPGVWSAITTPLPLAAVIPLVVVLPLATLVHELAHGLTLARHGGSPRRAGFMLLYLSPAFFVDVTDGWRLHRRHRVAVALAGIVVHAAVAAVCALAALVHPSTEAQQILIVLAVACAAVVFVNAIPFVRFDGYIAVMSAVDEPNLRARTMSDAAAAVRWLLFGGTRPQRSLRRWWGVPFGLLSFAVTSGIVLFALHRVARVVEGGGVLGALLVFVLLLVVAATALGLGFRGLRRLWSGGVSRVRLVIVTTAIAVVALFAGSVITVPVKAAHGFVVVDGTVTLVAGASRAPSPLPDGAIVTLSSRGLLGDAAVVSGVLESQAAQPTTAPVAALFPIDAGDAAIPAQTIGTVRLDQPAVDLPSAGSALISLEPTTAWNAFWQGYLAEPVAEFARLLNPHQEQE